MSLIMPTVHSVLDGHQTKNKSCCTLLNLSDNTKYSSFATVRFVGYKVPLFLFKITKEMRLEPFYSSLLYSGMSL